MYFPHSVLFSLTAESEIEKRGDCIGALRYCRFEGGLIGMAGGMVECEARVTCSVWPMTGQARCESSRHDLTLSFPDPTVHT